MSSPFLSFHFAFSFRLSLRLGFAHLKRNHFSPDYLDPRGGPSEASRPSPAALPTFGERLAPGRMLGRSLSPGLTYLGRATLLVAIRIQPENSSQLGRGRGLCYRTREGVWGLSPTLLPREQRYPETIITKRLPSRKLKRTVLSFSQLPAAQGTFQKEKEHNVWLKPYF